MSEAREPRCEHPRPLVWKRASTHPAFGAHSDTCEWPKGCAAAARWYYTTVVGRYSLCDAHTPVVYRTDPIPAAPDSDAGSVVLAVDPSWSTPNTEPAS